MNYRLLTAAGLDVLVLCLALQLTRWRGVERQLTLEVLILGLAAVTIIILMPALKRGSTAQVLLAILLGFPAAFLIVNAFLQLLR